MRASCSIVQATPKRAGTSGSATMAPATSGQVGRRVSTDESTFQNSRPGTPPSCERQRQQAGAVSAAGGRSVRPSTLPVADPAALAWTEKMPPKASGKDKKAARGVTWSRAPAKGAAVRAAGGPPLASRPLHPHPPPPFPGRADRRAAAARPAGPAGDWCRPAAAEAPATPLGADTPRPLRSRRRPPRRRRPSRTRPSARSACGLLGRRGRASRLRLLPPALSPPNQAACSLRLLPLRATLALAGGVPPLP